MKQITNKDLVIYERGKIKDSESIFKKIKKINIDYNQENVIMFCLSTTNKVLWNDILFKGGLDACVLDMKTIFRQALLKSAKNIVIAHNHPSGNLNPSMEDMMVFNAIKSASNIIDIGVLDFIIFNKKEFYSVDDGNNKF